jgi:hypothetical protein
MFLISGRDVSTWTFMDAKCRVEKPENFGRKLIESGLQYFVNYQDEERIEIS